MFQKIFAYFLFFFLLIISFSNCNDNGPYAPNENIKGITKTDMTGEVISVDSDDWRKTDEWSYEDLYQKVKNLITNDPLLGVKLPNTIYPTDFAIRSAYPNPFSNYTVFCFSVPEYSEVVTLIIDKNRKIVRKLLTRCLNIGNYSIQFDGKDDSGNKIKKGIYRVIYRFKGMEKSEENPFKGYGDIQQE